MGRMKRVKTPFYSDVHINSFPSLLWEFKWEFDGSFFTGPCKDEKVNPDNFKKNKIRITKQLPTVLFTIEILYCRQTSLKHNFVLCEKKDEMGLFYLSYFPKVCPMKPTLGHSVIL